MTPTLTLPDAPTFLTSGHHFGDPDAITNHHRDATTTDMDAEMIDRWNATVPPDGHVIHLGGFARDLRTAARTRPHLNGRITTLTTTNDPWHHGHWNKIKTAHALHRAQAIFDTILPASHAVLPTRHRVLLVAHLPYQPETQPADHLEPRPDDEAPGQHPTDTGLPLICGNPHPTWPQRRGRPARIHHHQINVNVDAWHYTPLPLNTALDYLGVTP